MNPAKVIRHKVTKLTDLPNIGPAGAEDLIALGIQMPQDLVGKNPFEMYEQLCSLTHTRHDPCVLDVFMSVTDFMAGGDPQPWWAYTPQRKTILK